MSGLRSKRKGSGFEREVVRALQDRGLAAERVPLSGAVGGSYTDDITCPVLGVDWRFECKRRARGFATIYSMLGNADGLFIRDDHERTLVVLPLDLFTAIAKGPTPPSDKAEAA